MPNCVQYFEELRASLITDTDPELFDVGHLDATVLSAIEADSFWCLSKLLDGIQDNYISQQPGIQRLVKRMSELVKRIDGELAATLRPCVHRIGANKQHLSLPISKSKESNSCSLHSGG